MLCFILFSVFITCLFLSFGQIDRFRYESDLSTRLNNLETKLTETNELLAETDSKLREASDTITSLTNQLEGKTTGSVYTRWGRTTCPGNGTELVFSGLAGGSHYTHKGGAANYMCLPDTPLYGAYYEDALQNLGGHIYGTEYELTGRTNTMNFFPDLTTPTSLLNNDVPCAVCKTSRSTMLMVPARNTCFDGWTLEYKGLLVGGHFGNILASEYICLDDQPETIPGSDLNSDGKLLYFVDGRCGSLPCPPYVDGRELTCAVCTE